jgi:hypothetical protein
LERLDALRLSSPLSRSKTFSVSIFFMSAPFLGSSRAKRWFSVDENEQVETFRFEDQEDAEIWREIRFDRAELATEKERKKARKELGRPRLSLFVLQLFQPVGRSSVGQLGHTR